MINTRVNALLTCIYATNTMCDIGLVERVPCDGEVQGLIPTKVTPKNATSRGLKPVS